MAHASCNQSKYFHPKLWKNPLLLQRLKQHNPTLSVQPDSCICRHCRQDINKLPSDSKFVPTWKIVAENVKSCYVHGIDVKVTKFTDSTAMLNLFCNNDETTASPSQEIPLCPSHHMEAQPRYPRHVRCAKYLKKLTNTRARTSPAIPYHKY